MYSTPYDGGDTATQQIVTNLVNELKGFGLTENEAKTYVALLRLGKAPARSIAKCADIPRQEIYRVLPKLERLGLAQSIIANPEQFMGISPSEALSGLIDHLRENLMKQISKLEERKMDLANDLAKIQGKSAGLLVAEPVNFILISGRRLINEKIQGMLEKARHLVQWTSPKLEVKRAVIYDRDEMLRRCARRGVRIEILTEVSKENIEEIRKLSKIAEIRHVPDIASLMTIVDGKEIIIGSALDTSDTELIHELWTNDRGQVKTMKEFFEKVWNHSETPELTSID